MKSDVNLDTYSRGEIALDLITFSGVGALSYSSLYTAIPLAALNATVIATTHQFLDDCHSTSKVMRIASLIVVIALTTLTIPLIVGSLSTQTLTILALEKALTTTAWQLAAKTAMYCLFNAGLIFRDTFFFSFPSTLKSLKKADAVEMKKHLLDFPKRAEYTPLKFQRELHELFKAHDLSPLPLTGFTEVGDSWTSDELERLHATDLSRLSLPKRAQIAELFFSHDLPPQPRPYSLKEIPTIDYQSLSKKLTSNQIVWAHLRTRLDPKFKTLYPISKRFYELKLVAPRDAWIFLPPLTSVEDVQALEPFQLSWYDNLFHAKPAQLQNLKPEVRNAFGSRLQEKTPVPSYKPPPLVERTITWRHAAIAAGSITAVALAAFATYSYFQAPPPLLQETLIPPPLNSSSTDLGFCPVLPPPAPVPAPIASIPRPPNTPLSGSWAFPRTLPTCPPKQTVTAILPSLGFTFKLYYLLAIPVIGAIYARNRAVRAEETAVPPVAATELPDWVTASDDDDGDIESNGDDSDSGSDMDLCTSDDCTSDDDRVDFPDDDDGRDEACPPTGHKHRPPISSSPFGLGFSPASPAPLSTLRPGRGVPLRLQLSGKGPGSPAFAAKRRGLPPVHSPMGVVRKLRFESDDEGDTDDIGSAAAPSPIRTLRRAMDSATNLLSNATPPWGSRTAPEADGWNKIFALTADTGTRNSQRKRMVSHGLFVLHLVSKGEETPKDFSPSLQYAIWGLIAQTLDTNDLYNWEPIELEGHQFYNYYATSKYADGRSLLKGGKAYEGFLFTLEGLPKDFTKVWVYRKKGAGASASAAASDDATTYVKLGKEGDRFSHGARARVSRRLTGVF
ncbi:MAG: hypothetical protein P0S96_03170 [Simkaniaceae bacterium]|nr:hypothetical protein [Candidatus Sacchlamyda saccharinae]